MENRDIIIMAYQAHSMAKKSDYLDILYDIEKSIKHYASIGQYKVIIPFPMTMVMKMIPVNNDINLDLSILSFMIRDFLRYHYSINILKEDKCLIDLIPESLKKYITDDDRLNNFIKIIPIKFSWEDPDRVHILDERV